MITEPVPDLPQDTPQPRGSRQPARPRAGSVRRPSAAWMGVYPRDTPGVEAEEQEDCPPNQQRHGRDPRRPRGVRGECGCHEQCHTDYGNYPSSHGYPSEVAGMASGHGSPVRWNRAAEYYRTVNPALLRLRKAPERVCAIHRATMTRPTRSSRCVA